MINKKIILCVSVTCLLLTPIIISAIPAAFPTPIHDYALEIPKSGWYGSDKFNKIAYVSFYTFFKSGIEPDCIDMTDETKEELT